MVKYAVIGSREFTNKDKCFKILDSLIHHGDEIVSGGAQGADTLAEEYAKNRKVKITVYKPDYDSFGKIAPLVRNEEIISESEYIVAFWNGKSPGTQHAIKFAAQMGRPILVIGVGGK